MTDGVCHCEEAAPTKQSGSAGLLRFARSDMNLSVRIPHHQQSASDKDCFASLEMRIVINPAAFLPVKQLDLVLAVL